ncbi:MAG: DUF4405 domain-containing protein [Armatimonadota bacterium]
MVSEKRFHGYKLFSLNLKNCLEVNMKPAARIRVLRASILVMAILFISQATTGSGFLFHISNDVSEEIHEYGGLLFVALIILHIVLNWSWISTNYLKHTHKSETK